MSEERMTPDQWASVRWFRRAEFVGRKMPSRLIHVDSRPDKLRRWTYA